MMNYVWHTQSFYLPFSPQVIYWLLPFVVLDLILKGFALWRAGRNNQLGWFLALLVLNTLGIFPLVYLAYFSKDQNQMLKK